MKIIRRALLLILVFLLVIAPVNPGNILRVLASPEDWYEPERFIFINEDTIWNAGETLVFEKNVAIDDGATLTIEPGVKIIFKKIVDDWGTASLFVRDGNIIAKGTTEDPIVFETSSPEFERMSINFYAQPENPASLFRHVEFRNGGEAYSEGGYVSKSRIFNRVLAADDGSGAFLYQSGKVVIENSRFIDNQFADIEASLDLEEGMENDFIKVINSNFESGAENAIYVDIHCELDNESDCQEINLLRIKNNWFNHPSGPGFAKEVSSEIEIDGFRKNPVISDPTIVIPGIMGSEKVNGRLELDPMLHTYDNLLSSLEENGFEKDINLFEFPYEWRNSNVLTANFLEEKIEAIRSLTGLSKVDIVAHSMGGLVAREYIQGENYNHDINQLITLGTPHNGSPEAFLQWEEGEGFLTKKEKLAKLLFLEEANHAGYLHLKDYIQDKILSVKELLPDYDYLFDVEKNEMRDYPDNYPRNTFLENLNQESSLKNLEEVDFTNIVGKVDGDNTIRKFRVVETSKSGKWEHGMPENFYDQSTDQGIEYGRGDETVPFSSASEIPSDQLIELESSHGDLPTKAQCEVLEILSGKSECDYITTLERITSIMSFGVFSPIDIQVVSPSGKRVGKDFETGEMLNEIDGAFYSGSDTENEFLTIPNPEDGDYQIITQGTGSGKYAIKVSQVKEFDDGARSRTILNQTGHSTMGEMESLSLDFEDSNFENEGEESTAVSAIVSESISSSNDDDDNDDNNDSKKSSNKNGLTSDPPQNNYSQNSLLVGFSSGTSEDSPKSSEIKNYPKEFPRVRGESAERNYFSLFVNLGVISIVVSGASGVLGTYRKKTK